MDAKSQTFQTEVKHSSQAIDGRYKTLFEQVNAASFMATLDGKILEANQKACELFGYAWDELVEKVALSELLPASLDWSQLIEEIASKGGMTFETEGIAKNSDHIPVEISTSLFQMEGKPVMLALIQDITERKKSEKKLKESEEKYRGLFESTTDGVIVLDARGEILDINSPALKMFKLEEDDVIGNSLLSMDLLSPAAMSIIVKQFEELLSDRRAETHEAEIKDKGGNVLNVEISSFFLARKGDDEVDTFVLTIRDVTGRRETEIKLSREHDLLKSLIENLSDQIYFKDAGNKFVMVNLAKAKSFNVQPEEMIGKTEYDFLPESVAKLYSEQDKEVMNTGKFIVNRIEKVQGKDGVEHCLSFTKIPRFDEEGNVVGLLSITRDLTALNETAETT